MTGTLSSRRQPTHTPQAMSNGEGDGPCAPRVRKGFGRAVIPMGVIALGALVLCAKSVHEPLKSSPEATVRRRAEANNTRVALWPEDCAHAQQQLCAGENRGERVGRA